MPLTMNVNEAKTHFSSLVSEVEKNMVAFTIMRYGRPVARLVPLESPRRSFKPIPGLAGKIKVKCDLFDDSSSDWEACDASATA
ncbi:MAG: type II toxin-antitoxin system Phd/YefM family antitoxin [Kiritimatiellae bacterium]|jgi:antitoxin (DNA-binding transcriptional repressor) of toxin-antitoxin stability system|nr:type II toxin-antitoxin system Phd/YefM family antitoxin [Kiritimatiellia bacterium]MBR3956972.1 type II toxin-antitoxin system Phd/YefM family antitoxin [Kiritimatiellia bacterium]MBR5549776.1 type II toxin-antitoxin system Phd/YefM family antitoxin [Kiritimatiellia bacterium]